MSRRPPITICVVTLIFTLFHHFPASGMIPVSSKDNNWTHFRGSNLNGIAIGKEYPVTWSDSSRVQWRTAIPGKGWSSPVVFGNQIWCTTATAEGKELNAVCIGFDSGEILYNLNIFRPDSVFRIHAVNSHATPTPCIEEGRVYVHFGTYGTACINTETGRIEWSRRDLNCDHIQGPGSSPILFEELLILHLEGGDVQFLVALNKITGETVWKTNRPGELYDPLLPIGKKAYITPRIIRVNGRDLLISNGSAGCIAYDVKTGEEVWRIVGGEDTTVAMPAEEGGTVWFFTSNLTPHEGNSEQKYVDLVAADPGGQGDVSETHVRWRVKFPPLQLSSPLVKDGLIYLVDTKNNLFCLDAFTGETVWTEKFPGKCNSSPIWANGNIYFNTTKGETLVIREGRAYQLLSRNSVEGEIWASPAFLRNSVLLRTSKYLYKIQ
jgi:outer membrane protein assembly factor BamB